MDQKIQWKVACSGCGWVYMACNIKPHSTRMYLCMFVIENKTSGINFLQHGQQIQPFWSLDTARLQATGSTALQFTISTSAWFKLWFAFRPNQSIEQALSNQHIRSFPELSSTCIHGVNDNFPLGLFAVVYRDFNLRCLI